MEMASWARKVLRSFEKQALVLEFVTLSPESRTSLTIGTLRYSTARCYYGYFGRDGLG